MLILGIETSRETGLALYDTDQGLLDRVLYSQITLHADYGGVVPELASRYVRKIAPLTQQLLDQTGCALSDLDGVAYTAGPGLMGALLVGASYARSLSWALNIPARAVRRMEAHLLAPLLAERKPPLPFVTTGIRWPYPASTCGATRQYELLGESVDDAAGEAFDKTAKLLDFAYLGPAVAKNRCPNEARNQPPGLESRFVFRAR